MRPHPLLLSSALSCTALLGCDPETAPATQIMVVVNSNLREGTELKRVVVNVYDAEGKKTAASREFAVSDPPVAGQYELPLSFSIVPAESDAASNFRVVAEGYASSAKTAQPIVEQKVIASFKKEQSLLLEMFLGRVCEGNLCTDESTCYVEAENDVRAGECGEIPVRDLKPTRDPATAIDEASWPDAGGSAAGGESGTDSSQTSSGSGSGGSMPATGNSNLDAGGSDSAGANTDADAGDSGDAGAVLGSDGGATGGEPNGGGEPGLECPALAAPAAALCNVADAVLDNHSLETAAPLAITAACSSLVSTNRNEQDFFRFTAGKHDPIAVSLAYVPTGTRTLSLTTYGAGDGTVGTLATSMVGAETRSVRSFVASAQGLHRARVSQAGTGAGTCIPYTLGVDLDYCTDAYEDNDSTAEARPLALTDGKITLTANSYQGDGDYYQLQTERADPVLITGTYTVDAASTTDLDLTVYNAGGTSTASDTKARASVSDSFQVWVDAPAPNTILRPYVSSNETECVAYTLSIDTRACTDAFEDNDAKDVPAAITKSVSISATGSSYDPDYYDVSFLAGAAGKCTLVYTVSATSTESLTATAYNGNATTGSSTSMSVKNADGSNTYTVTRTFNDGSLTVLGVGANAATKCLAYTLTCE